ncbi:MAG TPA: RNA 2',3'-cyclic phosphodiesterase [Actinomycetota bacterium]|nr:RNA 2',3'-cyclic phosphodiesterase [Actinomycetota bacterium]
MTEVRPLRLFVAVSLPTHVLEALAAATAELRNALPGGRWSPLENQHVTLKFLGSCPADQLEEIAAAVAMVAASHETATLRLTDLGTFPSRRRARVLWAGLEDEAELLRSLAEGLDDALKPLGFEPEKRAFTPHLTLARWRTPIPVRAPLPTMPQEVFEPFTVDAVELFRSHLSPRGARYEMLRSWPLAGTGE